MTWPTHTLFGISTLWFLALLPPEWIGYDFGTLAAIAALGSLLLDLDASESKIKHLKIPNIHIKPFLLPALVAGTISIVGCCTLWLAWDWWVSFALRRFGGWDRCQS